MEDCIFCKIIKGEVDCFRIYDDQDLIVILDKFPNNIGHSLIIPKKHVKNIFELDDNLSGKILKTASRVARAIQNGLKSDGINLLQNNNEAANQTVNHFHMHVIPRYFGDTVEIKWVNNKFSDDDFNLVLKKVKQAFSFLSCP